MAVHQRSLQRSIGDGRIKHLTDKLQLVHFSVASPTGQKPESKTVLVTGGPFQPVVAGTLWLPTDLV